MWINYLVPCIVILLGTSVASPKAKEKRRPIGPPVIIGPKNSTASVGDDVALHVRIVSGEIRPRIQWLKHYEVNDSYMSASGEPYIQLLQQSTLNISDPKTLRLRNVTTDDAGWYTCLVSNPFGRTYQSAWLDVKENDRCAGGWMPRGTKCYYVSRDKFNWIDSQMMCKTFGGTLVEIKSADENSFVEILMKSSGETSFWIGITDIEEEGSFKFPGETTAISFRNFGKRAPPMIKSLNCVEMGKHRKFRWRPANCRKKINFVCEK